jgi:hypothetical protein
MPSRLRRTAQTQGDVAVGAFLNHPQLEEFAIPLRQRSEYLTLRLRKRATIVYSFKSGISGEQPRHTKPTTSSVLNPPLPQRLPQDVPRDPKQPRKRRHLAPRSEPTSRQPSPRKDLGCQIGGMLANPRPRPRKHLSGVPVIDLLEPLGSTRPQELRVRRPLALTSHNRYLTLPRKMCHASRSLAGSL